MEWTAEIRFKVLAERNDETPCVGVVPSAPRITKRPDSGTWPPGEPNLVLLDRALTAGEFTDPENPKRGALGNAKCKLSKPGE